MTINVRQVGDLVRLSASFSVSGSAVDPATVTLTVMDPSGNSDEYTYAASQITKVTTGSYRKDISADEAGDWHYRWESTGTGQASELGQFMVEGAPL